jgi:hypothetical protein
MALFGALGAGLGGLPLLSDAKSRSISAENPRGEKGGGARAALDDPQAARAARELGPGWKVRPCITLPAGSVTTLAEIEGPGAIEHVWITCRERAYRSCLVRMYWDGEERPSVECPLGDFFACLPVRQQTGGHGLRYVVNSLPVAVNPAGGFNSYWPMPFAGSCRIEIENQHHEDLDAFFYQIDYALGEVPPDAARFHAQWRRSMTTRERPEHVILDGVRGRGQYVGTFLAWSQFSNGWWGEGEVKFYIDGDAEHPTYCGTGTEDYFGGAWGFGGETYSTAFLGYPFCRKEPGEVPLHALYRWHVMDPVRFEKDFRATVQALGWWPGGKYEPLTDDIASVGYWYQTEPHEPFPETPGPNDRWPR